VRPVKDVKDVKDVKGVKGVKDALQELRVFKSNVIIWISWRYCCLFLWTQHQRTFSKL